MTSVLITGAAGFIGSYLSDHLVLLRGTSDVVALDNSWVGKEFFESLGIPCYRIDLTGKADCILSLKDIPPVDVVVHLACLQPATFSAKANTNADYARINIMGTINLLEYCRNAGVKKFIYTVSHREMDQWWKGSCTITENMAKNFSYSDKEYTPYVVSQVAATAYIEHYCSYYGMKNITLRLPPVYGYGPHTEIFKNGQPIKTGIQTFIDNAKEGKDIEIWGNPSVGRDIIYVKDVVSAIIATICKDVGGLYNITSGKMLTVQDEVDAIIKVFTRGRRSKIIYCPEKKNSILPFVYDNSKAREALDWFPKYSFEDMLVDMQVEQNSGKFDFLLNKRRLMQFGTIII